MPTPFPTATVTQGSGLTVNTLPNAGQQAMDSSLPVVIANNQSAIPVTPSLPAGAATAAKQPALGTAGTASTDVLSVQGAAGGTAVPVSAASLPLPTGASTAAKQPALGTAGASSVDVLSVQGAAGGTALPVSAASLPLPAGAATNAGSANIATSQASVTTANITVAASRAGRFAVTITNITGTGPVYLGATGVSTSTGHYLPGVAGASVTIPTAAAVFGTVASVTQVVSVLETY
jgi:hypothetical protein